MTKPFIQPAQPKPGCGHCRPNKPCKDHADWHPPEEVRQLDPASFAHLAPPAKSKSLSGCKWCGQPIEAGFEECLACWKTQRHNTRGVSGRMLNATHYRAQLGYNATASGGPDTDED